jgi:predicted membrane protein
VKVSLTSKFTAVEEFYFLVVIISFICLALIFALIGLVIKFRLQKKEYRKITYEQNVLKRKGPDTVRLTDFEREELDGETPKASNSP